MSTNDPFAAFESERTVIKPRPKMPGMATAALPVYSAVVQQSEPVEISAHTAVNPLVASASSLLSLIGHLRTMTQSPDLALLRSAMISEIQRFEAKANRAGISNDNIIAARYVLCTALDESVSNTPWGVQASWSKQSLLVQLLHLLLLHI